MVVIEHVPCDVVIAMAIAAKHFQCDNVGGLHVWVYEMLVIEVGRCDLKTSA